MGGPQQGPAAGAHTPALMPTLTLHVSADANQHTRAQRDRERTSAETPTGETHQRPATAMERRLLRAFTNFWEKMEVKKGF